MREVGKKPILLHKELPGHVANRLQAALYREITYLIQQGALSVEDADDAVSFGPGLRWGVMGPSLQWHLGGGAGGIQHYMDTLYDGLMHLAGSQVMPDVNDELKKTIVDGVLAEAGDRTLDQLAQDENEVMLAAMKLRDQHGFG